MYRVIKKFADMQDNNYVYSVGDIYPREGVVVSEKRLDELSSTKNRRGVSLIEKVLETSEPKRRTRGKKK